MKKQKYIPTIYTPEEWKNLSVNELRKKVFEYMKANYKGLTIQNKDLAINIIITTASARKTAHGEAMYYKKAVASLILPEILEYAIYNNFGYPKETDKPNKQLVGFLNFKCKVKIDDKIENLRLAIRFLKSGKFYYNLEVNTPQKNKK